MDDNGWVGKSLQGYGEARRDMEEQGGLLTVYGGAEVYSMEGHRVIMRVMKDQGGVWRDKEECGGSEMRAWGR